MVLRRFRAVIPDSSKWGRMCKSTGARSQIPDRSAVNAVDKREHQISEAVAAIGSTPAEWESKIVHGRSLYPPAYYPRPYGVPVALLHFRSHSVPFLDLFVHFAGHVAAALGIPISRPAHLPTQRTLWTVPRAPFVHKKSQQNFERKVHKRAIKAWDADSQVVDLLAKYLERHALPGVGVRITRWHRAPVGVGAELLESTMDKMRVETDAQKVKALGERILQQELAGTVGDALITPQITQTQTSRASS